MASQDDPQVRVATGQQSYDDLRQRNRQGQGEFQLHPPPGQGSGQQQPIGPGVGAFSNLGETERQIFMECRREANFNRGMPLAIASGFAAAAAVKRGMLSPSGRFGIWPKVVSFSVLGYFVGKFSYFSACENKFLERAPDSEVSEAIRKRRGIPLRHPEREAQRQANMEATIEEWQRGGNRGQQQEQQPSPTPDGGRTPSSYDEMRLRNRGVPQSPPPSEPSPFLPPVDHSSPPSADPNDPSYAPPSKLKRRATNKYGDEGFE